MPKPEGKCLAAACHSRAKREYHDVRSPDELKTWVDGILATDAGEHPASRDTLSDQLGMCFDLIAGDASPRKYYRVVCPGEQGAKARSYVAVDAPSTEKTPEFLRIRALLERAGVRVPALVAADADAGFMLLEDLGDDVLLPVLSDHSVAAWYAMALGSLVKIAALPPADAGLPEYDGPRLQAEMNLFKDWFVPKLLELPWSDGLETSFSELSRLLLASAAEQPRVVVHRDFHSRNLMVVHNGDLAVIDFQDAVIGPVTYDPVSLLKDCYIQWPRDRQLAWLHDHKRNLPGQGIADVDDGTFVRWFDLMGLQRHIKVLGIFARLCFRDGKPSYLNDLPLVIDYVLEVLELYASEIVPVANFRKVFLAQVLPACRQHPWYGRGSAP